MARVEWEDQNHRLLFQAGDGHHIHPLKIRENLVSRFAPDVSLLLMTNRYNFDRLGIYRKHILSRGRSLKFES